MIQKIPYTRLALCVALIISCSTVHAQKHDSLRIYKKIKHFAYKHKFTRLVYQAVFVDPEPKEYPALPATPNQGKVVNPYLKYKGHVIRKIRITVYDPFGYTVSDTVLHKINTSQKLGNHLHVTTRRWVINNKLLFKPNDTLNALSISESERLLRQSVYINDARITVAGVPKTDSVDVNVVVQDKWPVTIPAEITDVSSNAKFRNQNLFGTGQQFEQFVKYTHPDKMDYSGSYTIANLDRTYISSQLYYQTNKTGTSTGIIFDGPFYSPLAQWAGTAALSKSWSTFYYKDPVDGRDSHTEISNMYYDLWLGKNIKISDKKTFFDQSTNLIIGERVYGNTFQKRPAFEIDTHRINLNTLSFVGNVGFSVQQYYKDKFIYRFGANEDVPEGLIIQFLYGAVKKEFASVKYYNGIEFARAQHFNFGYLSITASYGIFFNSFMSNDITTNFRLYYFSNLRRFGKWYVRIFSNSNLVYGLNKSPSEKLTLTADDLYGFSSGTLNGNTKLVMDMETVAYAPYNVMGFKFAPVLLAGVGLIDNDHDHLFESNLYQGYSLGLMVRNENLLSSTFQVSFGFYPFLPNGNNNVFKYNPVTSFTLRVRAFSVSKPSFVDF
ncbi:MAG: hypothetical protein ACXVC6_07965 [Bacteroidia bacterium]